MVFANLEKSLDNLEAESRQEGRMKEKEETALEMLRDRIDANKIAKYTKLPLEKINDLLKKM